VNDANAADRMAMGKNEQAHLLAAKVTLATLQTMGGIPDPGADELYESGLKQMAVARSLNPQNPVPLYLEAEYDRSAALLGLNKKNESEKLLLAALRLNPQFFAPRIALAQLYLRQNKNAEAYAVLKDGAAWRFAAPVLPEYYELLSRLALEAGDADMRDIALKGLLKTRSKKPEKGQKSQ
jgi:predicted Zn-dependent protease